MKKSAFVVLFLLMILIALFTMLVNAESDPYGWDGKSISSSWAGTGTSSSPYLISSAEDLALLARNVNSGSSYSGVYFQQTETIDLNEQVWTPIGTSSHVFNGTYDGNGYSIKNLKIGRTSSYNGLFGVLTGKLQNISIVSSSIHGGTYTGAVVGMNRADTSTMGCIVNCSVTDSQIIGSTYNYIGGITGYACGDVSGCRIITTTIKGNKNVGGIAGCMNLKNSGSLITIDSCVVNQCSVTGTECIGGICGYKDEGNGRFEMAISKCCNFRSAIEGTSSVGGIIGNIYHFYTTNAATGDLITISECANTGTVKAKTYAGGIAGNASNCAFGNGKTVIINCYNSGSVSASEKNAGGITGGTYKKITNCWNSGTITAPSYAHSINGNTAGSSWSNETYTATNCYYSYGACSDSYATALSASNKVKESAFAGWDFENVWAINGIVKEPILRLMLDDMESVISVPDEKYMIFVVDKDGTALKGANVTFNDQEQTTDESGTVVFDNEDGTPLISVSLDGYITWSSKDTNWTKSLDDRYSTIILYTEAEGKYLLKYALCSTNEDMSKCTDVLTLNKRIGIADIEDRAPAQKLLNPDPNTFYIRCSAMDPDNVERYLIFQKGVKIAESADGSFILDSSDFEEGGGCSIHTAAIDGTETQTSINLKLEKVTLNDKNTISLDLADSVSIPISNENLPFIGGGTLDIHLPDDAIPVNASYDLEENKIKIGFNLPVKEFEDTDKEKRKILRTTVPFDRSIKIIMISKMKASNRQSF